jgi:hypothetical protein
MAARKQAGEQKPQLVRKSLIVEADKLEKARQVLGLTSDAEVLRVALDHLLSHFGGQQGEEE